MLCIFSLSAARVAGKSPKGSKAVDLPIDGYGSDAEKCLVGSLPVGFIHRLPLQPAPLGPAVARFAGDLEEIQRQPKTVEYGDGESLKGMKICLLGEIKQK
ncbi:MAG: hypothetical protein LBD40_02880 [Puniceicoccales bacterium]|nr:hypothetical protein [Puniceicoccales bacterium]